MKRILQFIKNNILGFILGLVIAGVVGVYAVSVASSDVTYDNTSSGSSATTVKAAIDDLYTKVGNGGTYHTQQMHIDPFTTDYKDIELNFVPTFVILVALDDNNKPTYTAIYRSERYSYANWAVAQINKVEGRNVRIYHAYSQYQYPNDFWLYATDQPLNSESNISFGGANHQQMHVEPFTTDYKTVEFNFEPTFLIGMCDDNEMSATYMNGTKLYDNWARLQFNAINGNEVKLYHAYSQYQYTNRFWLYATDMPITNLD